ncbi:hypothetical protein [Lentibacter sp. XHP0401]|nr:hypothetical protein [Lentibacter sp. XHP0401]MCV2893167.1 hypothetical protein [Lentibacter sp. XHP0401]
MAVSILQDDMGIIHTRVYVVVNQKYIEDQPAGKVIKGANGWRGVTVFLR